MLPPRLATPADAPELVRIINAAYRVEDFFIDGDRTSIEDVLARQRSPGGAFLVVPAPGSPTLEAAVYLEVRGTHVYFGPLAVDPALQKRGLGRHLIEAVEAYACNAGCTSLDIDVVDLRTELPPFYRRLGFKQVGIAPFPTPHKLRRPAHLILFTKSLLGS